MRLDDWRDLAGAPRPSNNSHEKPARQFPRPLVQPLQPSGLASRTWKLRLGACACRSADEAIASLEEAMRLSPDDTERRQNWRAHGDRPLFCRSAYQYEKPAEANFCLQRFVPTLLCQE